MSKSGVISCQFKDDYADAQLWKDDVTGKYTLSIDDPWEGFERKDIVKLRDFLNECLEAIKRRRKWKADEG